MISLYKCKGTCNVLSPKICVPKETKYINVKAFNIITIKNEVKAMFHGILNAISIVQYVIQIKNVKIKHANVNIKIIVSASKTKVGIPEHVLVTIVNIQKILLILQCSVTKCDEIIIVMDNVSIKKTNAIARNVTSTTSINCNSKKIRDCYILPIALLAIILQLMDYYFLSLFKTKGHNMN